MDAPYHDHKEAFQDYWRWLEDARVKVLEVESGGSKTDSGYFVPASAIKEYFTEQRVARILQAIFGGTEQPNARDISKYCPTGLCILICIGHERHITSFASHSDLWDKRLPFPGQAPAYFPHSQADPDFFKKFYDAQWPFCPEKLKTYGSGKFRLQPEHVLPLREKRWLASGVTADLHHVVVHPEYDCLRDRVRLRPKLFHDGQRRH